MPAPNKVKALQIPGVRPPTTTCDDPNCPWHGSLRVRGVLLEGVVEKLKANKTAAAYAHWSLASPLIGLGYQ